MTATVWIFLSMAGVLAVADWIAVSPGIRSKRAEYFFKPATLVALIGAAAAIHPEDGGQRGVFIVALVLSLAGDVFLMLPRDLFVAGLGAFLLAHIAYVVGFLIAGMSGGGAALGVVVVVAAGATVGVRIVRDVTNRQRPFTVPVVAYMTIISTMVVVAMGSGEPLAAAGALLFYSSDAMIAWDRFVGSFTWARPAIMSTYHLAQAALVSSLLT